MFAEIPVLLYPVLGVWLRCSPRPVLVSWSQIPLASSGKQASFSPRPVLESWSQIPLASSGKQVSFSPLSLWETSFFLPSPILGEGLGVRRVKCNATYMLHSVAPPGIRLPGMELKFNLSIKRKARCTTCFSLVYLISIILCDCCMPFISTRTK